MLLAAEHLSINFGTRQLLSDVNFYLEEGKKAGIIGINGTGKSTFLKVLAGVIEPDGGRITQSPNVQISYLPQNPVMDDNDTVLEQVFLHFPREFRELSEYEAADVYGPSIPKMTATEGEIPDVEFVYEDGYTDHGEAAIEDQDPSGKPMGKNPHGKTVGELIIPVEKFGVKWMSIGYFAKPEQALIWRGAMACNALKQMTLQVKWGELDFLLLDLPPGTGDIHISMVHDIPLNGAIIVTTPQAVALADVEKGINMFRNKDINKPIFGLVENMAWFTPAELPENKYYIFGKDGGKRMAEKYNVPLLGQIPLVQGIRECGDEGIPAAVSAGPVFDAFVEIAKVL